MLRSGWKLLALFAVSVLIGLPASATKAEPSPVVVGKPAADPARFTVLVHRDVGGGRSRSGTGTVVACEAGKSLVLTNAHVADDPDGTYTVTHAGTSYPATYIAGSAVSRTAPDSVRIDGPDLALLTVDATLPTATIATDAPRPGDRVRLWGFGGRQAEQGAVEKSGRVLDGAGYVEPTFVSNADTASGDSGSGVFNDAGELVAVHWGGTDKQAYAVPLGTVRAFLREKVREPFPQLAGRLGTESKREPLKAATEKGEPALVPPGR